MAHPAARNTCGRPALALRARIAGKVGCSGRKGRELTESPQKAYDPPGRLQQDLEQAARQALRKAPATLAQTDSGTGSQHDIGNGKRVDQDGRASPGKAPATGWSSSPPSCCSWSASST